LTSPDLDEMVVDEEPLSPDEIDAVSSPDNSSDLRETSPCDKEEKLSNEDPDQPESTAPAERLDDQEDPTNPRENADDLNDSSNRADDNNRSKRNTRRSKKARSTHKEQWDRRLLSYVRKRQEELSDALDQESRLEHNLAVEVVARDAVCGYERDRGRVPEQMPQTHPGYDIVSRNPVTGEERFIEVKGVNGEWNQTGVGLSRLQFSNAQDYGDRYWLYVVEFTSDPEHIRVHPIQSPATQVTAFMFDGNWREAVTEEQADPTALYIPGARIQHQDMGRGQILDVVARGSTKLLTILFDGASQKTPNVTLNLYRMRILEEADGDIDS
jgi:hypothetical protein